MLEDEDSDRIEKICPVCKKEASKRCSRCAMVYYCCVEHQQQDWKVHKTTCQPFKVGSVAGLKLKRFIYFCSVIV